MRKCAQILAVAVASAMLCAAGEPDSAKEAASFYQAAERATRAGDSFKAYLLYVQAAKLNPGNAVYQERKTAIMASPALAGRQIDVDPANETITAKLQTEGLTGAEKIEADRAEPPVILVGTAGEQSFDLRGDSRTVVEQVAGAFGIQVVFDTAYQALPNIRFQVTGANYQQALRMLETSTDSFLVPMSPNLALVARETAQNRTQFAPEMSVAVPIPERISAQEAQEIVAAVQGIIEVRRISLDPVRRVVYLRDTVPKVLAAREMFANLARLRGQIEMDVEMISMSKTSSLIYGLSLPTSSSLINFAPSIAGFQLIHPTTGNYGTFGGGGTFLGLGITNSRIFATLSRASSDSVLSAHITGLDGQAAALHIGDRYPVITATYEGLTPDTTVSSTLVPNINYQDLGVVLKITPTIHAEGEISLDVEAEFKTLGVGSSNGIPVIASSQYQGKVRLRGGEWAVLAGLVSTTETNSLSGIAGLSSILVAGHLFRQRTRLSDSIETLLVIKPRIVALPPWEKTTSTIWTGTETRPITPF